MIADTSAWIRMMRQGDELLFRALRSRQVEVHPLVYGELACGNARKRRELLDQLGEVRSAAMLPHGIVVRFLESHRLYGRNLSWIDVHLLASASLGKRTLHTHDSELALAAESLGVLAKM